MLTATLSLVAILLAGQAAVPSGEYFQIAVVDDQTGRGVPLVELRTVHNVRYWTDSAGLVAFYEPGLMDRKVFFHVASHGYEFPKDRFGNRGRALQTTPGGSARLEIKRLNVARRLYRVTGAGIYHHSLLVGRDVPLRQPVLNAQVLGSDSVLTAMFGGKVHWFWGDTNRPGYPLGNFHTPGAVSLLPEDGGLEPDVGVDLNYFLDEKGFAKETARMPGEGPTWLTGLVVLGDRNGRQRMFAAYAKVRKFLDVYQRGLVEFDPAKQQFRKVCQFELDAPLHPLGHPFKHTADGIQYVYFGDPYPLVRVRCDPQHLEDLSAYQAFTCLKPGSRLARPQLDRDATGALRYGWKRDTPAVGPKQQARLIAQGLLRTQEALLHLQDVKSGEPVSAHRGSVCWNPYRHRWILIAVQSGGTSNLGEVWYAEADAPEGPWVYAAKIITHEKYSFYNPRHHPMFDADGGRVIFLEGTYTALFSGNSQRTPRYNYNQIMYKLELSDARLVLPVPVYRQSQPDGSERLVTVGPSQKTRPEGPIALFACDRPADGTLPVYGKKTQQGAYVLQLGQPPEDRSKPLFYALRCETADARPTTVPLYEFVHRDGVRRVYATGTSPSGSGYRRSPQPICRVWRNPVVANSL